MRRIARVGFGLILTAAFATPVAAQQSIVGSAHDFSGDSWNSTGQICIVCHTPHNADATVAAAPLWNHQVTVASHTPYTSATMTATTAAPSGTSKLCLSCHDGTVALDNFSGITTGTQFIGGSDNFGTDLSNDHPISFTYDAALATADGELADPTTTNAGLLNPGTIDATMLFAGSMECASCHDVHRTSVPTGVNKLLLKSNSSSALCVTCHSK